MIYQFKGGCRYNKECDPQQIGERLERIRVERGGQLRVDDVVMEAANPASVLHPAFTWDDITAAENWRQQEGRQLIRSIVVAKTDQEEPMPAFYNIKVQVGDDLEQFYQSVLVLEQSPREYQAALTLLLGQLEALDHSIKELRRITPRNHVRQVDQAQSWLQRARNTLNP